MVTVATAVIATLRESTQGATSLDDLVSSDRFVDVALYLAAVAGAVVGARIRGQGLAAAWWSAGADRVTIVGRALGEAVRVAAVVPVAWWATHTVVTCVRTGLPSAVGDGVHVLRILLVDLLAVALFAGLGLLVGLVTGQAPRAIALVSLGTLPFTAEGLDIVSIGRLWTDVLSPFGAARGVVVTGSGNDLQGYVVDRTAALASAAATVAWAALLLALALRVGLAGARSRRPTRPWVVPAAALGAVGLLGAVGPAALAPGVPWQLRPAWRHAEAIGRSSPQQAAAWLTCRRDPARSCRRYEAPTGVDLPASTRSVLARGIATKVAPARFQTSPTVVDAYVGIRPDRSGQVTVQGAALQVHLRPDHRGGWVVDAVSAAHAVVR